MATGPDREQSWRPARDHRKPNSVPTLESPSLYVEEPRPEERALCARLGGRPQARPCPWPSFETPCSHGSQDEVRGFDHREPATSTLKPKSIAPRPRLFARSVR